MSGFPQLQLGLADYLFFSKKYYWSSDLDFFWRNQIIHNSWGSRIIIAYSLFLMLMFMSVCLVFCSGSYQDFDWSTLTHAWLLPWLFIGTLLYYIILLSWPGFDCCCCCVYVCKESAGVRSWFKRREIMLYIL